MALNAEFLEAAAAASREPSQVVADLMEDFVDRHRQDYQKFLQAKVDEGRRFAACGEVYDSLQVEKEFAVLRDALRAKS